MDKNHKKLSAVIFSVVYVSCFLFELKLTNENVNNIVTFFSILLGFYISAISFLYGSSFMKRKHHIIDEEEKRRESYKVKAYMKVMLNTSFLAIISVILFSILADVDKETERLIILSLPQTLSLFITSFIMSISALNIYFAKIIINLALDGMIEEASSN